MKLEVTIGGEPQIVEIDEKTGKARLGDQEFTYEIHSSGPGHYGLRIGDKLYKIANLNTSGRDVEFSMNDAWVAGTVKDEQALLLERLGFKDMSAGSSGQVNAPMPGKVLEVMVSVGDDVSEGQPVVILEAMKMENELKAPVTGKVIKVTADSGQSVEKNEPLIEIEAIG